MTDISVRSLKAAAGQTTFWDAALPAFGIRVGERSKTFIVVQSGGRRLKVGSYPEVSLQDARKAAKLILASPSIVPVGRTAITVQQASAIFLQTRAQRNRPATKVETERLLQKHMLPELGELKLADVTAEQIISIVDALAETPGTANNTFSAMRTFFNWTISRRYLNHSPMAGLSLPTKRGTRDRVLTDAELAAIYRTAIEVGYPFGTIILICIHTGMRRGEVASLLWSNITPEHIIVPAEIAKNDQEHMLPNLIGDILKCIPKSADLLFPSSAGTTFSAWSKNKLKFDQRCGVTDWVLHDLRRTFSTKMAEWQIAPPHVTERILNHTVGSMTPIARIYNRWNYLTEMRDAMQHYEARLSRMLATHRDQACDFSALSASGG